MIILSSARRALVGPTAHVAVFLGVRIDTGCRGYVDGRLQPASDEPVICGVITGAVRLRLKLRPGSHDVHELGKFALQDSNQVRIKRKLQDGATAGVSGQLGVGHLVGPSAQRAGLFHSAQDVGAARKAAVAQSSLANDLIASTHGGNGVSDRTVIYTHALDDRHLLALVL